ncbi:hypothetical protein K7432_014278 [Basidiobolus ranarum]
MMGKETVVTKKKISAFTAKLRKHKDKQPENAIIKDMKFEKSKTKANTENSKWCPPQPTSEHHEPYSNLRIKNRKFPIETMNERMYDRQMIRLSNIQKNVVRDDIPGNWVTIGVIGEKKPLKITKKGDPYYVIKISDFKTTISVIMFGKIYEKLWAEPLGSMVAILNPKILRPTDRSANVAIQVDHPNKFMNMGESVDFGLCTAVKKDGLNCNAVIDSRLGEYCESHLLMSYRKQRMNRMEFATGISIFEVASTSQKRKRVDPSFKATQDESYILDNGNMLVLDDNRPKADDKDKNSKKQKTTEALMDKLKEENSIGASYIRKIQGIQMSDSNTDPKFTEQPMDSEKVNAIESLKASLVGSRRAKSKVTNTSLT